MAYWVGRGAARAFDRLQRRFRWRPFGLPEAAELLGLARGRAALVLSRLARAGWAVRTGRAAYVALDPRWVVGVGNRDPLERYRGHPYFRPLVAATAGCLQLYGARLRSLALFGSVARLDYGPESDIDLLVVADPLPATPGDRLAELEPLAEDCQRLALESRRRGDGFHAPQFVPWTPAQVAAEPPLLLDLTEDADVLFDPDRVLSGALETLREKLRRHGARRVVPVDGPAFWLLHPGARVGEVAEL